MKKGISFFLIVALFITVGLWFLKNSQIQQIENKTNITQSETKEVDLNTFLSLYNTGVFNKIKLEDTVKLQGYEEHILSGEKLKTNIFGQKINKMYTIYTTSKPPEMSLQDLGISFTGNTLIEVDYNESSLIGKLFLEQILPLIFFILILVLAFKFFGPKGGMSPFGKGAGILRTKTDVKTKFKDVAGMEEVKQELIEVVDFLKNPKKYEEVGAKIPKGVLLYGPPGSGKTLVAKAVAGEAGVPFFSAAGSEFMEMLVGMGASKVRNLFKKAKAASPAIIFIDEIDSIGKKRGGGMTGGHQEQEQTLNQILTEMDGFDTSTNVIVIAATNRPDSLDPALLRSGRFDRKVMVGRPNIKERELILQIHAKGKKLHKNVDLAILAKRTSGFVGADLANIINEAALKVAKENRKIITMDDLDYALEKVIMGPEKKMKTLKEKERKIVTYHELGHAVTAYYLPNADPVEKISIVSRGMALGVTWMMPEEDTYLYSKAKFLDEMVSLLGGRAAEEIFFGKDEITTGASNDFEKVTKIAYDMILKYGMDKDLGTLIYFDKDKGDYIPFKPFSEKTSELIDQKIKKLVQKSYNKALEIIQKNKILITKMGTLLLEKEDISRDEFEAMMKDPKKIDKLTTEFKKEHIKKMKKRAKTEKKIKKEQEQLFKEKTPEEKEKEKKEKKESEMEEVKKALEKFLKK